MNKIREGARLSQRDMHKINELYQIIEAKSDKDEIL